MIKILPWKELLQLNAKLSIPEAMQAEIDGLRRLYNSQLVELKLLRDENIEQWEELLTLRKDVAQHEDILQIYLNKVTRLKTTITALEK